MESKSACYPAASILTLPTETRFMIYDQLLTFTGTIVIFANFEFSRNADKQTMSVMHVNRLIRFEVHEFFYKYQQFQFRSYLAMTRFLNEIGPYYTSIMTDVQIGTWLAQHSEFGDQIGLLLKRLSSIDRLSIIFPARGFVSEWEEEAKLGHKAVSVLYASERLANGKLRLVFCSENNESEVRFVAKDSKFATEKIKE